MTSRAEKNKHIQNEIDRAVLQKRMQKITKTTAIFLGIILLILAYGIFIGAKVIFVHELKVTDDMLPSNFHGLKIVHFSDILYPSFTKKDLNSLKNKINELNPDIIIFTGDIKKQDIELSKQDMQVLEEFLSGLEVSINKYAVIGDQDDESFQVVMENSQFKTLNNLEEIIYYQKNTPIRLLGFNSNNLNFENLKKEEVYSLCIFHNPDDVEKILKNVDCNLAFAGDTRGGEIKILKKPLFNHHKYNQDFYQLENTKLYISNGIGNQLNIRLFNHPSINFYRLTDH